MPPHPHLTEFKTDLSFYKQIHLLCISQDSNVILHERIFHQNAEIEQLLILVNLGNKLYKYTSPRPIDTRISQVALGMTIKQRLKTSTPSRVLSSIASIASSLAARV
jgi:hypothetical protein